MEVKSKMYTLIPFSPKTSGILQKTEGKAEGDSKQILLPLMGFGKKVFSPRTIRAIVGAPHAGPGAHPQSRERIERQTKPGEREKSPDCKTGIPAPTFAAFQGTEKVLQAHSLAAKYDPGKAAKISKVQPCLRIERRNNSSSGPHFGQAKEPR
jgi:hypothetical protein